MVHNCQRPLCCKQRVPPASDTLSEIKKKSQNIGIILTLITWLKGSSPVLSLFLGRDKRKIKEMIPRKRNLVIQWIHLYYLQEYGWQKGISVTEKCPSQCERSNNRISCSFVRQHTKKFSFSPAIIYCPGILGIGYCESCNFHELPVPDMFHLVAESL